MTSLATSPFMDAGGLDVLAKRLHAQARGATRGVLGTADRGTRVLWSGSREWSLYPQELERVALPVVLGVMDGLPNPHRVNFLHGAARGLDRYIHTLCMRKQFAGVTEEMYPIMPEEREVYGAKAGIARDKRMIENDPAIVFGLPHPKSRTGGTWACLRLAHSAGIPAFVVRELLGMGWRVEAYRPKGRPRQFEVLF